MQASAALDQAAAAPDTSTAASPDCFITVPEVTLPGGIVVPSFRVGQYASTRGADGKAAVTATDVPWVNISYHAAREACAKAGFQLITEKQWLAIALDVSRVDSNWTGGKVGEGKLRQGIRLGNYDSAQPGHVVPEDDDEMRWLTLSNGERICDLNGNVYQWVFDDVQGDENGIVAREFAPDSLSITTPPYPSRKKGMGDYEVWDWSGHALLRGGCWSSGSHAGVFSLYRGWPDRERDDVGFRSTQPIGL